MGSEERVSVSVVSSCWRILVDAQNEMGACVDAYLSVVKRGVGARRDVRRISDVSFLGGDAIHDANMLTGDAGLRQAIAPG